MTTASLDPKMTIVGNGKAVDQQAVEALSSAVGAAAMLGADKTRALLEMSDARVGSLFKQGLVRILWVLAHADEQTAGRAAETTAPRRSLKTKARAARPKLDLDAFEARAQPAREALVADGLVLPAQAVWTQLGVTRQALQKAVASGRIFTVDIGARQYYPAFYVSPEIDRKTLAKVTQALGALPGWSKWQFFTTPKGSLNGETPLDALKHGNVPPVLAAATAFADR